MTMKKTSLLDDVVDDDPGRGMSTDNVAKGTAGTGSVAKKLDIEEDLADVGVAGTLHRRPRCKATGSLATQVEHGIVDGSRVEHDGGASRK